MVACRPCRRCTRRRACFLCRPPTLPLACFPTPHPPPPSPAGKGETLGYFMQGASPLASPAFNRLRHLQTFSNMNPAGGLPSLPPAYPAFSLLPCPLSPSPFPNGEGEIYGYFMQGASPLASPGLSPSGAGSRGEPLAQKGACPVDCRLTLPPLYLPGGGLPSLSPAAPAFSLPFCPHPPSPLPLRGRGSPKVYFAGGFAPGAPALDRLRRLQYQPSRYFGREACPPALSLHQEKPGTERQSRFRATTLFIMDRSSGGSGGLFQESPSALPAPRKARNRTTVPIPSYNTIYYG